MKRILLMLSVALLIGGCRSVKTVERIPVIIHDTMREVQVLHDSTFVDRWHTEIVRGDTMRVKDSVSVVRWIERADTVEVEKEIPVEMVKEIVVEKSPSVLTVLRWSVVVAAMFLIVIAIAAHAFRRS